MRVSVRRAVFEPALRLILRWHRPLAVATQLGLVGLSNYLAFWLRFDGAIPEFYRTTFVTMLPLVAVVRVLVFWPLRLFEGLWRYTSLWDLQRIIVGVLGSSAILFAAIRVGLGRAEYPRSVYILDALLLILLMSAVRLARRFFTDLRHHGGRRVLVYGAGDTGDGIARELRRSTAPQYQLVGFVDDDPLKQGRRIQGAPVLGVGANIVELVTRHEVREVLLALPPSAYRQRRRVLKLLETHPISIKTIPNFGALLGGRVAVSEIRELQIQDLLPRAPVNLDHARLDRLIRGRRIMVTGAGGSIGSELCQRVAAVGPSELLMLDQYENGLYEIQTALADSMPSCKSTPLVVDLTDRSMLDRVMAAKRPDVIFHAAAHKHVPLMEINPCEAVKNNVTGSRNLLEAAGAHAVDVVVLISSDKAVQPSSVMGATKRLVEMLVKDFAAKTPATRCSVVRFGNVLGSNGSVVPRFLKQVRAGGPVTVTHPDVSRYFMLLPEAALLVLHAATLGRGGDTYVLDMGEPLRLADLARNLIRLAGMIPDEQVQVVFTGLRPGEKLYEELVWPSEEVVPTSVPKVLLALARAGAEPDIGVVEIAQLEALALSGDDDAIRERLAAMFPSLGRASTRAEVNPGVGVAATASGVN